ncbi:hypothetical protein ACFY84_07765 [Streptomyces sp. NPDC012438]|uniref:hypothetical protein n=1 Tax=unclassified Streptomyces TaxID=2593676 RepID=UPI0036444189
MSMQQCMHQTLKELNENQRKLTEFTFAVHLDYEFPGEVNLVNQVLMSNNDEVEVALFHSLRFADPSYEQEASEMDIVATMTTSADTCRVESSIRAHLGFPFDDDRRGTHVLHHSVTDNLIGDAALRTLGEHVNALCENRDFAARLGFTRRS